MRKRSKDLLLGLALAGASLVMFGACGQESAGGGRQQPEVVVATPAQAAASAAATPPLAGATAMPGGGWRVDPGWRDVATLQRMPDGTLRRRCGAPTPEVRAMLDNVARARRGTP